MSQARPSATPATRWPVPPRSRRTCWGSTDTLECLAVLTGEGGRHREAARLFGAAHAIRQRNGAVTSRSMTPATKTSVTALRGTMGENDFDAAWAEGAALTTEAAIAYAQRHQSRQANQPARRRKMFHPQRARCRATRQRRTDQQRNRHKAFHLHTHRANAPDPRLHQIRPDFAGTDSATKQPATPDYNRIVGDYPVFRPRRCRLHAADYRMQLGRKATSHHDIDRLGVASTATNRCIGPLPPHLRLAQVNLSGRRCRTQK